MNSNISIQTLLFCEKNVNYTILDVKWLPFQAKTCSVGCTSRGKGVIDIFELYEDNLNLLQTIEVKKAIRCCSLNVFGTGRQDLVYGDINGDLSTFNIEKVTTSTTYHCAHDGIINCIDSANDFEVYNSAPEIVSGGRDGRVKIWDLRQKNVPVATVYSDEKDLSRECWSVAFGNSFQASERMIACGYDNGDLKLIDLRNMKIHWETNLKNGICSIEFNRKNIRMDKLTVTTLEGGLYIYDMRNSESAFYFEKIDSHKCVSSKNFGIEGSKATIWSVKHSPQNRECFMTTSGGGCVDYWKYEISSSTQKNLNGIKQLNTTNIASQPVTSFDWSQSFEGLAICGSIDQTIRALIISC